MPRNRKSKKPKSTDSNVNEKAKSTDSNVNKKAKSTDSNANEKAVTEASKYRLSLKDLQEKIPPEYYSSKPFEHVIITWTVSNFIYYHGRKFSLRSSRLYLNGAEPSLWYVGLTPKLKDNTYDNNLLDIVLVGRCTNPLQNIRFEGRVGYINFPNKQVNWLAGYYRETTTQRHFSYPCVADILRPFCSFKIVCELYIYKYSEPEPFVYSLNTALTMKIPKHNDLGERKNYITIMLPDGNAYKIDRDVCYQSPVLKEKIINSENNTIILRHAPTETVQCLAYLHLKRVDYLVDNWISFELYGLAKALEIQELINLLSPSEIHIDSETGIENFTLLWEVKENESLLSDIANTKFENDMSWRIRLKETEKDFQLDVKLEKGNPEYVIYFELSAFDNEGNESTVFKRSFNIMKKGEYGLHNEIIHKNPAVEYKRIVYRMCNSNTNMRFNNKIKKLIIPGSTQTTRSLEESMVDLSIGDDSNIVIIAGNKKFEVHKEILESRSDSFLKLLSDKNKSEVTVPDIPADLMELILHFIYYGKLNTRDRGTVRRLYKILDQFRVEFLPIVCLEFFSVDNTIIS